MSHPDQERHLQVSGGPTPNVPSPISSAASMPHASQLKILFINGCCDGDTFEVVDSTGQIVFRFSEYSSWSSNRVLQDDYGRTIASLKQKRFSNYSRWNVYRGEPHPEGDLLFTMAKPKMFQRKTSFNIWLAGKQEPDFVLTKSKWDKHFKISHQEQIIAEADYLSRFFHPDEMIVTTLGGVDLMFISSVLIMERILANQRRRSGSGMGGGGAGGGGGGGGGF